MSSEVLRNVQEDLLGFIELDLYLGKLSSAEIPRQQPAWWAYNDLYQSLLANREFVQSSLAIETQKREYIARKLIRITQRCVQSAAESHTSVSRLLDKDTRSVGDSAPPYPLAGASVPSRGLGARLGN